MSFIDELNKAKEEIKRQKMVQQSSSLNWGKDEHIKNIFMNENQKNIITDVINSIPAHCWIERSFKMTTPFVNDKFLLKSKFVHNGSYCYGFRKYSSNYDEFRLATGFSDENTAINIMTAEDHPLVKQKKICFDHENEKIITYYEYTEKINNEYKDRGGIKKVFKNEVEHRYQKDPNLLELNYYEEVVNTIKTAPYDGSQQYVHFVDNKNNLFRDCNLVIFRDGAIFSNIYFKENSYEQIKEDVLPNFPPDEFLINWILRLQKFK